MHLRTAPQSITVRHAKLTKRTCLTSHCTFIKPAEVAGQTDGQIHNMQTMYGKHCTHIHTRARTHARTHARTRTPTRSVKPGCTSGTGRSNGCPKIYFARGEVWRTGFTRLSGNSYASGMNAGSVLGSFHFCSATYAHTYGSAPVCFLFAIWFVSCSWVRDVCLLDARCRYRHRACHPPLLCRLRSAAAIPPARLSTLLMPSRLLPS